MTKQQYLAHNLCVGFYPNFGKEKVKTNLESFSMQYKGETFDFEVYQSRDWYSEKYSQSIVVAEGIDFRTKIDSIRLFGSHCYIQEAEAYKDAILKYCKKHDLQICHVRGDSPISWVIVQPAKIHKAFAADVATY